MIIRLKFRELKARLFQIYLPQIDKSKRREFRTRITSFWNQRLKALRNLPKLPISDQFIDSYLLKPSVHLLEGLLPGNPSQSSEDEDKWFNGLRQRPYNFLPALQRTPPELILIGFVKLQAIDAPTTHHKEVQKSMEADVSNNTHQQGLGLHFFSSVEYSCLRLKLQSVEKKHRQSTFDYYWKFREDITKIRKKLREHSRGIAASQSTNCQTENSFVRQNLRLRTVGAPFLYQIPKLDTKQTLRMMDETGSKLAKNQSQVKTAFDFDKAKRIRKPFRMLTKISTTDKQEVLTPRLVYSIFACQVLYRNNDARFLHTNFWVLGLLPWIGDPIILQAQNRPVIFENEESLGESDFTLYRYVLERVSNSFFCLYKIYPDNVQTHYFSIGGLNRIRQELTHDIRSERKIHNLHSRLSVWGKNLEMRSRKKRFLALFKKQRPREILSRWIRIKYNLKL